MFRRKFSEHQDLNDLEVKYKPVEVLPKQLTDQDRVIDLVFMPDPKTGLPQSDISVYLSAKTPVQVREFIKANIFGEPHDRASDFVDGLDDDTIAAMVRGKSETVEEYSARISQFMTDQKIDLQETFAKFRNVQRSKMNQKSD